MKRKTTAYQIVQAFILVLVVLLLPLSVWAQETKLTAVVPSSHTLHIELTGNGTVVVDGVAYTKTADVQVQRHSKPEIVLLSADGFRIKAVRWSSEDVTAALQNGKWTTPEITEDTVLTVTFEKISGSPQTGDLFHPEWWICLLALSTLGLAFCLWRSKKKCA